MRRGVNTYPSVVSAGRDLLTGCVKTTGLSHLEETAKLVEDESEANDRRICAGGKNDCSASFGQVADLGSICVVERSESVQSPCRAKCCLYCQAFKVLMFGAAALSDMCA